MSDTDPRMLLELYLLGELDEAEARRVEAWLAERSERRAELEAARRAHEALEQRLAAPPDARLVAERIVARLADRQPRPRRRFPIPDSRFPIFNRQLEIGNWKWVAAAVAAVVLGLILLTPPRRTRPGADVSRPQADLYPEPRAEGTYLVSNGDALSRGSLVRAGAGGALIELGGYCRLELAPDSVVRLSGAQRQESVFLEEGMVACEVDRNVGGFAVETEFCTVSALGTRFVVQLRRKGGEAETPRKEAYVRVLAGAALVSYPWGQDLLVAR